MPAAVLFVAWPGLLEGVRRGLVALAAANPWYADIKEFNPVLFGGTRPVSRDLAVLVGSMGLVPIAAGLAYPAAAEEWRRDPGARPRLAFFAVWVGVTFVLGAFRNRFLPYFAVPGAIATASGALWLSRKLGARIGRATLVLPLAAAFSAASRAPALPSLAAIAGGAGRVPDDWIEAARWLRGAPVSPDGRAAVAAPWSLGHLVQYFADRPVISSPFGTEAGARGASGLGPHRLLDSGAGGGGRASSAPGLAPRAGQSVA